MSTLHVFYECLEPVIIKTLVWPHSGLLNSQVLSEFHGEVSAKGSIYQGKGGAGVKIQITLQLQHVHLNYWMAGAILQSEEARRER